MKKKRAAAGLLMMIFIVGCSILCSCQKKEFTYQGDSMEISQESPDAFQEAAKEDVQEGDDWFQRPDGTISGDVEKELKKAKNSENTIVWITTGLDGPLLDGERLQDFNKLLHENGFSFELAICYLYTDSETICYQDKAEELLEEGYGDICWTGNTIYGDKEFRQNNLVRKGYFMELDSYLQSEKGKGLWRAFYPTEWESAKMDGKICMIPNQNIFPRRSFVAFSDKYVSREDAERFKGDFSTLKNYITSEMKEELKDHSLVWQLDYYSTLNSMGIYDFHGIWGDHETGELSPPFSDDRFYQVEKLLWECNQEGLLFSGFDFTETWMEEGRKSILNGQFGIAVFSQEEMLRAVQDEAFVVELPCYYVNATEKSTGIVQSSEKKEDALKLLELLYSDSKYANKFVFGEKDLDYVIKNGCAYDSSGVHEIDNYVIRSYFGINDAAYTAESANFSPDVRKNKKEYFDRCKKSAFIGFHPDSSNWEEKDDEELCRVIEAANIWREKDFESAYRKMKNTFVGSTAVVRKDLERQMKEWRGRKGRGY